ncbi:MAG: YkgJ family cysteine cluster protein [Phycisphaerae bacterium]|jgi:Fe-S-cluster containining protein
MAKKKKVKKALCHKCAGLCCRYVALPIETPTEKGDFDDIRWYLTHKHVSVFVEKKSWYISIENKCRYLSAKDHRCRIYDKRPRICRGYKNIDCEFSQNEYNYDLHFTNDREMEEYIKIKFDNNKTNRLSKVKRLRSK